MRKLSAIVLLSTLGILLFSCFTSAASIADQWAGTKHNAANLGEITDNSPIMRDRCITCHDGEAFANKVSVRADLPTAVKDKPNGIDCGTCHGSRAQQIMKSGTTDLLDNGFQVKGAGTGALCISCHNGRKLADPVKTPTPHSSAQFDVLFAASGARVPGAAYPSSPHGANPDTCVSCHMAEYEGLVNHTFEVFNTPEYVEQACGSCHPGLDTVNRISLADYDGNLVVDGFQDEIKGLLALLQEAVDAKQKELGIKAGSSHGALVFTNAAGETVPAPVALYNAHFNIALIESDGSFGIHNPAYAVALLQKSYKELTGQDIPNAVLR